MQNISTSCRKLQMLVQHISYKSSNIRTIRDIQLHQINNDFLKIILNRPKSLNSLNIEMVIDLTKQLQFINKHKILWIQGSGDRSFCAGGDVKVLFENNTSQENRQQFFRKQFSMDYKISQFKTLQIANWDGIVMGGGVGISAFAPFIIASENTMYAMPEGKIGFFTDVGAGYFLSRLRNNIGYYLGMTGARLKGQEVFKAGLANYYIPKKYHTNIYEEIHNKIIHTSNPKQFIINVLNKYHKVIEKNEIQNQEFIREIFSYPTVQEIYKNAKKNMNKFHQSVAEMLEQQCPLSVHVTHKSIQLSKSRSIRECFIQDFIIAQHFISNHNFAQGVRCALIDKGSIPKWTHQHLTQVKSEEVEHIMKQIPGKQGLAI